MGNVDRVRDLCIVLVNYDVGGHTTPSSSSVVDNKKNCNVKSSTGDVDSQSRRPPKQGEQEQELRRTKDFGEVGEVPEPVFRGKRHDDERVWFRDYDSDSDLS